MEKTQKYRWYLWVEWAQNLENFPDYSPIKVSEEKYRNSIIRRIKYLIYKHKITFIPKILGKVLTNPNFIPDAVNILLLGPGVTYIIKLKSAKFIISSHVITAINL